MSQLSYVRPQEARARLNISDETLKVWAREGKIKYIKTRGGHRRYNLASAIVGAPSSPQPRKCICYARVSSSGQKEDLGRQVEFFRARFPNHEIIQDIGSGLNFKRKGFRALLGLALRGAVQELVVTYKDRLCRFGFELLSEIVRYGRGRILVLNQDEERTPEAELCADLLSIVTVFSARIHGFRSGRNRRAIRDLREEGQERKSQRGPGQDPED